ncbi:MAG: DNA translocase FtsK [Firmicutes bacterium]|nr:DNA translocase FtsK [Bacillota bacterium]
MLASVTVLTGLSIIGGIRLIASYLRPSRYEEDEEYGEYEEYGGEALLPGGSPPGRDHTPTPGSAADAGKKRRAGVIDIPDPGRDRDGRKLALFHEEMNNGKPENPLFGSRRVDRDENWPGSGPGPDGRLPPADAGRPGGREIKLSGLVEAPGAEARRDPRGVSGDADEADNPDEADESYEDEDFRKDAFDEDEDAGESVNDRRIEGESGKDRRIEGESGNDRRIELFRKPGAPPEAKASPALKAMPEPIAFVPRERSKTADIPGGINTCADARFADYRLPPITLLKRGEQPQNVGSRAEILENSRKLEETLASFRVEAKVVEVSVGPTVTRYEMSPGQGVKVSSIANLSNDLALSLAAQGIRIEAPIPGKSAIGIEIPNKETQPVLLRDILEDEAFRNYPSKLAFAVGKDIGGSTVVADVAKMPHLLIAGATGSGKSVCIHTLIASILYKARPDEVKFIMVDPKVVELNVYNGIPHLLIPVVTDPKKAAGALNWAVIEMDRRYNLFAEQGVRDIKGYNAFKQENGEPEAVLAQIVIIIDELADLMMLAKGEVEETICRLAQKARAAGLHLIVATQRPSVDVITGLIKANIPSRLVFAVSSGTDSRTVLDMIGAEKLLGKGDMLFLPVGRNKPMRLQCGFISDREVENLVDYLKTQIPMEYDEDMIERVTDPANAVGMEGDTDEFFEEAVDFLIQKGKASASVLQRQFRIGYNRASRLIEELEARGIVGPEDGSKPRKVLIKRSEWENR